MFKSSPRSLAPLLAAAALPFTPALAQEVSLPTVQAPPAAQPAPAPVQTAPAAPTFAPQKPVVQNAPPPGPRVEDVARQAEADAARTTVRRAPAAVRTATVTRTTRAAPAAAVAASPVSTPPVATPAPVAVAPEAASAPEPAPAATAQTTTTTTETGFNPLWAILGAVALAAIGALLFFRRRRDDAAIYDEEVYEEPVYVEEPVALAEPLPVAAAPVTAERPQIEIGIRPIRAGSENGQARVDYELILENAGGLDAGDVTVTSWLLDGAQSSDAETALIEPMTQHVAVGAGESASVPASASLDHARGAFRPVVAADARYALPDGSEGRIAAKFALGVDGGEPGRITPIVLDRDELREDLGARLEGEVERA